MAEVKDYVPIIQRFAGENFSVWKFQMTLILNSRELMSIVDGSEKKPAGEATDPLVIAWTKKNTAASSLLVQTIDQEILKTLVACTIATEMWSNLSTMQEKKATQSVDKLQKKFFDMKFSDKTGCYDYITSITMIVHQLKNLGDTTFNDRAVMVRILGSLPKAYGHFVTAWNLLLQAQQSLETLKQRLLEEEDRIKEQDTEEEETKAFAAWSSTKHHNLTNSGRGQYNQASLSRGGGNSGSYFSSHPSKNSEVSGKINYPASSSRNQINDAYQQLTPEQRRERQAYFDNLKQSTTCYECRLTGHWAKECVKRFKRLQDEAARRSNQMPTRGFLANSNEDDNTKVQTYGGRTINSDRDDIAFMATDSSTDDSCELITHGLVTSAGTQTHNDVWFADSGATRHMTGHYEWFSAMESIPEGQWPIRGISSKPIYAQGIGRIDIERKINGIWKSGSLDEVLFVPGLASNLFSLSRVATRGVNTLCTHDKCYLLANDEVVMEGHLDKMLYKLLIKVRAPDNCLYAASLGTSSKQDSCQTLQTWHNRLSHLNYDAIRTMTTAGIVDGIEIKSTSEDNFCEGCVKGKQHRNKFPVNVNRTRASQPGQLIHTDICGPMSVESIGGALYFAVFKDDCTCYRIVHCLNHKSDVQASLKRIIPQIQRETGYAVQTIRSDRGKEFTSQETTQFLQEQNVRQELTVPYCPEQNGVTERDNRTIVEAARSMLHSRDIPLRFWGEAVQIATYILNRTYTRLNPDMTPYEAWFGIRPSLAHTKIFGCDAYIHVLKEKRSKLQSKSQAGMFLGYSDESKAYRIWNKATRKVCITRDVIFHKTVTSTTTTTPPATYAQLLSFEASSSSTTPAIATSAISIQEIPADLNSYQPSSSNSRQEQNLHSSNTSVPITRPQRARKPVQHYGDWACLATATSLQYVEPLTYDEALSSPDCQQWEQAMIDEHTALVANQTWTLMELPSHRTAVACKWTYRLKFLPDGTIARYKARLVAKGFSQRLGIDFFETYSPVVSSDSIRVILSIVAVDDLEMRQFDITTAFLNSNLDEEIYMQQPRGFIDSANPNHVYQLHKSLYGLRQARRAWNQTFTDFLRRNKLTPTSKDPCVYVSEDLPRVILLIFVDDGLICCSDNSRIDHILAQMNTTFIVKDDSPDIYIGLRIRRNRAERRIFLDQQIYVERQVVKYGFSSAKTINIPADPNLPLTLPRISRQPKLGSNRYATGHILCT
jgi:transposase InsO family protein